MQKVVGSNPISRFFGNPLHIGGSDSARVAESKMEPSPHIAVIPGTMRVSAWNGPGVRR